MRGAYLLVVVIVGLLLVAGGVGAWFLYMPSHLSCTSSYGALLRDANVSETVVIAGTPYRIESGSLVNPSESERDCEALRLAYALALARHAPLFGTAGTNPDTLEERTQELVAAVGELQNMQPNASLATLLTSLYPSNFLLALAELERRRHALLSSGSQEDEQRYREQLSTTLVAYQTAINAFAAGFAQARPDDSARFVTFGGTLTTAGIAEATQSLRVIATDIEGEHAARSACLDGASGSCTAAWFTKPASPPAITKATSTPDTIRDVSAVYRDVTGGAPTAPPIFGLTSSACLPQDEVMLTIFSSRSDELMPVYMGDLLYTDTAQRNTPVLDQMQEAGISRSFLYPLNYYFCPALQHDSGRLHAMLQARSFAETHPTLAPVERGIVMDSPVTYESDIIAYLEAAGRSAASPQERAEVAELSLMFNQRSAGLEYLIATMSRILRGHVQHAASGLPFDISVPTRFLMHSALPSLFAAYADDTLIPVVEPHSASDKEELADFAHSYVAQRDTITQANMADSLRKFLIFEGRLPASGTNSEE